MKLQFFCPRWGSEALSWTEFARKVSQAGYDGVEMSLPLNDRRTTDEILKALADHKLSLIGQHWETVTGDVAEHCREYRAHLEWVAAARPLFLNSQTGRDWFSAEDNRRVLDVAHDVAAKTGVKILHETHRAKFAYAAAVTAGFLRGDPRLRLTADFSHWCNVSESLLEDQREALALAIERTDHLHSRVGHAQGPQVSDPRAPEWKSALDAHLAWWDQIVERHRKAGANVFTVTTEFGPSPYLPALPYTGQPVADQWTINVHMMALLRQRWGY